MDKFISRWSALELQLIGICAALALLIELPTMVTRYLVPNIALGWAEQIVVYLLIWALWLSGSQLVEKNEHIHNDLLLQKLPERWQRLVQLVSAVLGLLFCAGLGWGGWAVVHFAWTVGEHSEGGIQVPLAFYYLSVPIGTALMCGKYLLLITRHWRREEND